MKTFIKTELCALLTTINDNFVTICAFITFAAPVAFFIACVLSGNNFMSEY